MFRTRSSVISFDWSATMDQLFNLRHGVHGNNCRTMGRTRYMFNKPDICLP